MEAATQPQAHMLNQVGNFICQYLVGSGQQAALLTESGIPPYSLYDSLPADFMTACWQHPCFGVSEFVSALFRRFFAKSPIKMRFVSAFRRWGSVWQKT